MRVDFSEFPQLLKTVPDEDNRTPATSGRGNSGRRSSAFSSLSDLRLPSMRSRLTLLHHPKAQVKGKCGMAYAAHVLNNWLPLHIRWLAPRRASQIRDGLQHE